MAAEALSPPPRSADPNPLNTAPAAVDLIHIFIHTITVAKTNREPAGAYANVACHGIAFEGTELPLSDPAGLTREDLEARGEARFVTVGADALGRVVAVVYAYRSDHVRLISACPATRREKEAYAHGI